MSNWVIRIQQYSIFPHKRKVAHGLSSLLPVTCSFSYATQYSLQIPWCNLPERNWTKSTFFRVWTQWTKHVLHEHNIKNSHLQAVSHWHGLISLPQWKSIYLCHITAVMQTLTVCWKLSAILKCIFMQMLQCEWQLWSLQECSLQQGQHNVNWAMHENNPYTYCIITYRPLQHT